ncbi:MAG: hypothetical protein RL741_693 [Actinomycetota bacterium]
MNLKYSSGESLICDLKLGITLSKPRSIFFTSMFFLVATLGLSACTSNTDATSNSSMGSGGMMGTDTANEAGDLSQADVMFLQMMIPHHEQAVEMSTLAETNSTNPEVLALAARIKAAQGPEIELMSKLLTDAGQAMMMDHSMGDNGMLGMDDMSALAAATGKDFDVLFLTGMIAHHEGAIDMTNPVTNSENIDVKKLAESIITSQTAEIAEMTKLLATLS